jgi:hypothetical protein
MKSTLIILWSVQVLMLALCAYMIIRNQWVYRNRLKLLNNDWDTYKKLPSYHAMMRRFWIWDINKFING